MLGSLLQSLILLLLLPLLKMLLLLLPLMRLPLLLLLLLMFLLPCRPQAARQPRHLLIVTQRRHRRAARPPGIICIQPRMQHHAVAVLRVVEDQIIEGGIEVVHCEADVRIARRRCSGIRSAAVKVDGCDCGACEDGARDGSHVGGPGSALCNKCQGFTPAGLCVPGCVRVCVSVCEGMWVCLWGRSGRVRAWCLGVRLLRIHVCVWVCVCMLVGGCACVRAHLKTQGMSDQHVVLPLNRSDAARLL